MAFSKVLIAFSIYLTVLLLPVISYADKVVGTGYRAYSEGPWGGTNNSELYESKEEACRQAWINGTLNYRGYRFERIVPISDDPYEDYCQATDYWGTGTDEIYVFHVCGIDPEDGGRFDGENPINARRSLSLVRLQPLMMPHV